MKTLDDKDVDAPLFLFSRFCFVSFLLLYFHFLLFNFFILVSLNLI